MIQEAIFIAMSNYIDYHGREEVIEINKTLENSKLFIENLKIAVRKRDIPNGNVLSNIVSTCHFSFVFAPKRKIYFGSVLFLQVLYNRYTELGYPIDDSKFMLSLTEAGNIMAK